MIKKVAIGFVLCSICFALGGWFIYRAVIHRADQGYVRDGRGGVYRLYRMQSFGMGGDLMAVYRPDSNPKGVGDNLPELP